MRVLVAGAGYVGAELARRLAAAGHEVLALRRSAPPAGAPAAPSLCWLAADLTSARALAALPLAGVEALAYLVAADAREDAAYRRAYVDGVATLLARLQGAGELRRVVYASSTSVYAQDDGDWVDEASPAEPASFTGRRVLEGEATARTAGCESVALRLGGIYGPGRDSLLERVRAGKAELPGAPHFTNRIHRDDAAAAMAHLLALPRPAGCYVGVDCAPADRAEVLRFLAAEQGAPEPRGDYDPARPATGKRCRSDALRASGFAFAYPTYREGYAALLREGATAV